MPRSTAQRYSASVARPIANTISDSHPPSHDRRAPAFRQSSSNELPDKAKPIAAFAFIEACTGPTAVSSDPPHHQSTSTTSATTHINRATTREKRVKPRTACKF